MNTRETTETRLTPAQQALSDLWDEHVRDEFAIKDANAALDTMMPDAYVNHVPVLTGGVGKEELREFYSKHFIPNMPADTEIIPISRTIGSERLVDEMIIRFTHTIEIDWMASRYCSDGQASGMRHRRRHNLPRRKTLQRAHLLGSSFRACAARAFGFIEASSGGS